MLGYQHFGEDRLVYSFDDACFDHLSIIAWGEFKVAISSIVGHFTLRLRC